MLMLLLLAAGVFFISGNLNEKEPEQIRKLREAEVALSDGEHQEYYFSQLNETGQRVYREMLEGIKNREESFYLSVSGNADISRIYHAVLYDHPELFWAENRNNTSTTSYSGEEYCLFSPGYSYTDEEIMQIQQSMENAYQSVYLQITDEATDYDKVSIVYSYVIDTTEYTYSDDDQNIAGVFWKKQAVCAGYARAVQYLLERLEITCIYVSGDTRDSDVGHAWNIVELNGQYYYVDATNGDQPQFLQGDAVQLAEHKTILYDYLCPFPGEYEQMYTASAEFSVPQCAATDLNFYVLNQACFDSYDYNSIYNFSCMRLDNGAAVVRFKFSFREAFDSAVEDLIDGNNIQSVAQYYMNRYGLFSVEYHYGILDDLKTIYFIF